MEFFYLIGLLLQVPMFGITFSVGLACMLALKIMSRRDLAKYGIKAKWYL